MNTWPRDIFNRISSPVKRPEVMLPMVYLIVYVVIHIAQIVIIEKRVSELMESLLSPRFWKDYHANLLSAFTVGLSSGLLMLSLAVALKHRVSELAIAAPACLFGLFTIFLIGQTLVLISGHLAIFSAAKSVYSQASAECVYSQVIDDQSFAEWGVVLTPLIAITTLLAFEAYLGRAYKKIRNIFPRESVHEIDNIRFLVVLAVVSVIILILFKGLPIFLPLDRLTISAVVALTEIVIFCLTVMKVTKI